MSDLRQFVMPRFRRSRRVLRTRLRRLRDDSGSAVVELGLTLAIVGVPILLGTAHFGTLLMDSIKVTNAAHAGAEYGMQSATYAGDTSYIQAEAQTDSGMGTNLTVTPTVYYVCSTAIGGTQYTTHASAISACTGGSNHPLEFLQVVASTTVTPAISFPGAANSVTLSSTSVMEVEE
jgi:Flp pilus assembly protein TadG